MPNRPEHFSGLGNRTADLDSNKLEAIYQGIAEHHGQEAARAFVATVHALEKGGDVSATTFLVSLYNLEQNGWQYTPPVDENAALNTAMADELRDTGRTEASTMGLLLGMSGGSGANISAAQITGEFLARHRRKIPQEVLLGPELAFQLNADPHTIEKGGTKNPGMVGFNLTVPKQDAESHSQWQARTLQLAEQMKKVYPQISFQGSGNDGKLHVEAPEGFAFLPGRGSTDRLASASEARYAVGKHTKKLLTARATADNSGPRVN